MAFARPLLLLLLPLLACTTPSPATDAGANPDPDASRPDDDAAPADATIANDSSPADPDASPADAFTGIPPEVDGRITINEFMTYNAVTILDDTGIASDWVELYNPTDQDLALGGYTMTDTLAIPARAVIPDGITISAGGYLVLWLDHAPHLGPTHLGFHLARESGDLVLARPDGSPIDRITYGTQAVDFSAAREPDGSDHWELEWHPSPGAANPPGIGAPVGLENPAAPAEAVAAAGDLTELLLGYDVLLELEITMSDASIIALRASPYSDVPGMLILDGRSYGPVGVRLKGQNSFESIDDKPSLRINIDEYVPRAELYGLKDLTLNNMDNDLSMMHERIGYLVARHAGIPASRANHALLTINGDFYGVYTNVETVKHKMLTRWFAAGDAEGPLFEGWDVDFVAGDVADFGREAGPNDRSLLGGMASALAISDPDAAIAAAAGYANMARFHDYWAMASVIGQFDGMPYSNPGDDYLVYARPGDDRITFLPWGMDETFYNSSGDVTNVHSVLAIKCKASPACFQAYVDRTWELLAAMEILDWADEAADAAAQIAPYLDVDDHKPYTTATVLQYQTSMRNFINNRRTRLGGMLPPHS